MGPDAEPTSGVTIDETIALVRDAAQRQRKVADDWSRIHPETITTRGYAAMSIGLVSLLRTNAQLLDELAGLIVSQHERRNTQRDYQTGD